MEEYSGFAWAPQRPTQARKCGGAAVSSRSNVGRRRTRRLADAGVDPEDDACVTGARDLDRHRVGDTLVRRAGYAHTVAADGQRDPEAAICACAHARSRACALREDEDYPGRPLARLANYADGLRRAAEDDSLQPGSGRDPTPAGGNEGEGDKAGESEPEAVHLRIVGGACGRVAPLSAQIREPFVGGVRAPVRHARDPAPASARARPPPPTAHRARARPPTAPPPRRPGG